MWTLDEKYGHKDRSDHKPIYKSKKKVYHRDSSLAWDRFFRDEVKEKVMLLHMSDPKMTRRPAPPHYVNGFVRDKRAQDKINTRMFASVVKSNEDGLIL